MGVSYKDWEGQLSVSGGAVTGWPPAARREGVRTFSLTRIAEHWSSTPIILCGFQVTELALKEAHDALRRRCQSERGNSLVKEDATHLHSRQKRFCVVLLN